MLIGLRPRDGTSLALELGQFNIRVRLIIPGRAPQTAFGDNARARMGSNIPSGYADLAAQVFAGWQQSTDVTRALDVAEAVWRDATDPSCPMRLPAGADAVALAKRELNAQPSFSSLKRGRSGASARPGPKVAATKVGGPRLEGKIFGGKIFGGK